MKLASPRLNVVRAGVRGMLRSVFSQERRTELKRLQGLARKRFAPVLSLVNGTFTTQELLSELTRRLPQDFEILMVHSSFDGFLPMYKGAAKELASGLIDLCGQNRTLVMPSFVLGGRNYDTSEPIWRARCVHRRSARGLPFWETMASISLLQSAATARLS